VLRNLTAPDVEASSEAEVGAWVQALAELDACVDAREAASQREHIPLPLPHLRRLFGLSRFEEQCLVIAAAPELDLRYEKLYAYLHDDVSRKRPSVGLALKLLCDTTERALAARAVFDPQAPLFRYRLCRLSDPSADASSLARLLTIDDRIVDFVLDRRRPDPHLDKAARLVLPDAVSPVLVDEDLRARLADFVATLETRSPPRSVIFHLLGPPGTGKRALAEAVCRQAGRRVLVADLTKLSSDEPLFEESVWRLGREALLQPAALCLDGFDLLAVDPEKNGPRLEMVLEAVGHCSEVTFLLGRHSWSPKELDGPTFVAVDMRPPGAQAKRLWEAYLARETDLAGDVDAGDLAGRFRLGPGSMHQALERAHDLARWRSPRDTRVTLADVTAACRSVTTPRLSTLARKIVPQYEWNDLVLPSDPLDQLRELCNHARYRHVVLGDWGFGRKQALGKGLSVLFSGPPGTGKTMAAQVIAAELQLDLYQIDLSQVVSKYIGETEKNLGRVFDEADASQAVLFFDEADALFGKRSEVKDAHDRYANIEIGYLLQRMEEYEGIAVLATNLKQNLDEAFVRRLRFIVEFPFPDEEHRRRIWEVTVPAGAPLGDDVDFAVLARDLKLPGGNIRNIALAAAFSAAADGGVIAMAHFRRAARREHQKLGRSWNET
jgi:AAA+ superfamily predicted ATPase